MDLPGSEPPQCTYASKPVWDEHGKHPAKSWQKEKDHAVFVERTWFLRHPKASQTLVNPLDPVQKWSPGGPMEPPWPLMGSPGRLDCFDPPWNGPSGDEHEDLLHRTIEMCGLDTLCVPRCG